MTFTKETLKQLETEYNTAVNAGKTQFTFQGQELLVSYAKYLIEYLQTQFK